MCSATVWSLHDVTFPVDKLNKHATEGSMEGAF